RCGAGSGALEGATRTQVWKSYTIPERPTLLRAYADGTEAWGPSGGGIWSSPTIDARRGALYVASGNSYSGPPQGTTDAVLAFDLKTGALRWAHQLTPTDLFRCVPGALNCADRLRPGFAFWGWRA